MQTVLICMKCQSLFPGQDQKIISKYRLLDILPRMLSIEY